MQTITCQTDIRLLFLSIVNVARSGCVFGDVRFVVLESINWMCAPRLDDRVIDPEQMSRCRRHHDIHGRDISAALPGVQGGREPQKEKHIESQDARHFLDRFVSSQGCIGSRTWADRPGFADKSDALPIYVGGIAKERPPDSCCR